MYQTPPYWPLEDQAVSCYLHILYETKKSALYTVGALHGIASCLLTETSDLPFYKCFIVSKHILYTGLNVELNEESCSSVHDEFHPALNIIQMHI